MLSRHGEHPRLWIARIRTNRRHGQNLPTFWAIASMNIQARHRSSQSVELKRVAQAENQYYRDSDRIEENATATASPRC